MQISTIWMRESFDRFNKDYFGGELPLPKFSLSNARTRLGSMTYKWKSVRTGPGPSDVKRVPYNHCIHLSVYYEQSERDYQNTLLHEMIHYYISVKQLDDSSSHGPLFRQWMQRLNEKGWNITVRETETLSVASHNKDQWRVVLALTTARKEYFLCVISPRYVRTLERQLAQSTQIVSHSWHLTNDDYFLDYPQSRTLRGRQVDKKLFDEKTKTMEPLKF